MAAAEVKPEQDSTDPKCRWIDHSAGPLDWVTLSFMGGSSGLKKLYGQRQIYEYFRPMPPVRGYPALAAASIARATPEEDATCSVHIGLNDDLFMTLHVSVSDHSPYRADPCGRGQQVGDQVTATLASTH